MNNKIKTTKELTESFNKLMRDTNELLEHINEQEQKTKESELIKELRSIISENTKFILVNNEIIKIVPADILVNCFNKRTNEYEDNKESFVKDLSDLLSKYSSSTGVKKLEYLYPGKVYNEEVLIYRNGAIETVNVSMNGYIEILKDVCKYGFR